jgi:hypothetical protein
MRRGLAPCRIPSGARAADKRFRSALLVKATVTMNTLKPLLLSHVTHQDRELCRLGTVVTTADPARWDALLKLLGNCNGQRTIECLASTAKLDPELVRSTLDELQAAGFVWLLDSREQIPIELFHAEFKRWLPVWTEEMYDQEVWERLYEGEGSPAIMVGWAIENMHYTRSVIEHMTWAFALAGGHREERLQLRHLSEEWDHYHLFRRGCVAAGVSETELAQAVPLPTTRAITHFMRVAARHGAIVYNACEALLEATTEPNDAVIDFYRTVGDRFGLPVAFTDELVRHVKVDANFNHIDLFDEMVAGRTSIAAATVRRIFECCSRLASLYALWNTEIAAYYRRFATPVVRTH